MLRRVNVVLEAILLETVSEAVRHLPADLLALRPDIAWGNVRGIGNRIRHEARRIDPGLIWSIVREDLPGLRSAIQDLRRRLEPEGGPAPA